MSASDLARRWAALVADGRGRWLPGMHTARGLCVVLVGINSDRMVLQDGYGIDDDDVPDWDHHGTTGGLLALVRLAWGLPIQVNPPRTGSHWLVYAVTGHGDSQAAELIGRGATEPEALLSALEAAPKGAK